MLACDRAMPKSPRWPDGVPPGKQADQQTRKHGNISALSLPLRRRPGNKFKK
jgi:hypothetical protein